MSKVEGRSFTKFMKRKLDMHFTTNNLPALPDLQSKLASFQGTDGFSGQGFVSRTIWDATSPNTLLNLVSSPNENRVKAPEIAAVLVSLFLFASTET